MFDYLSDVGRSLRGELVQVYWILLVPLVLGLIVLEFLKDENPNLKDILRRVIVSVVLLYSFEYVISVIAIISDGITERIDGIQKLWDVLKALGPNYKNASGDLFNLRETFLYFLSILAYIVAYLGFFVSNALIHFVWTVLYICSPLMTLAYVSRATAGATASLYRGLVQVVIWKILWSILGVLLLKLAMNPQITGMEDYLMGIIVNLSIGLSMLFIPIATKSLINDGMQGAASAIAAVPTYATGMFLKAKAAALASRAKDATLNSASFLAKPLTNQLGGRAELLQRKIGPPIEKTMKRYSETWVPSKLKGIRKNELIKKMKNGEKKKDGR